MSFASYTLICKQLLCSSGGIMKINFQGLESKERIDRNEFHYSYKSFDAVTRSILNQLNISIEREVEINLLTFKNTLKESGVSSGHKNFKKLTETITSCIKKLPDIFKIWKEFNDLEQKVFKIRKKLASLPSYTKEIEDEYVKSLKEFNNFFRDAKEFILEYMINDLLAKLVEKELDAWLSTHVDGFSVALNNKGFGESNGLYEVGDLYF
ncbi:hypothetical protein CDIK_1194 [Cucumispora dikerogammari]|nr:hypothetical protein CDIK_1194 [Cucumispora dikerogammari]